MTSVAKPAPADIRRARTENPKMLERDLAASLGISEADLLAAQVGEGVRRIESRVPDLLRGLAALGEVLALTRNESAVHEKVGVYDKPIIGDRASMMLGADIDLRIFPSAWVHGFAVEKRDGDEVRRSFQFFDASGDAVHKVHLRPASNVEAYEALVASLLSAEQDQTVATVSKEQAKAEEGEPGGAEELRERWGAMTDVHQFFGMLKQLRLSRRQAVGMVGEDYAWLLDGDPITPMLNRVSGEQLPIMCFVGNHGCIQIHSGPVAKIAAMGPWINVLDEGFHLHLRLDHVREVWAVRKPTRDGHVTSLEAYGGDGELLIQFFGKRGEGHAERGEWRAVVEDLPRVRRSDAA